MNRILAPLLGILLAFAASGPTCAQAVSAMPPGGSFSAQQRQEIVEIVRAALKADPTILRDAVVALQADDGRQQEAAARTAITQRSAALLHDTGDPVAGNPAGDVTVVEFYDVRCPYCRRMLPVTADLLRQDPNIRLVLKNIPILGPGSVLGAKAELAAQRQGGLEKLRDILMTGTTNIDQDALRAAAQRAGLDWDRLQRDMADPAIQARLDANLELARALQIQGTPAYVIGDRMLPGAVTLAELQDAVATTRKR